jgi:hypothetical protein
MIKFEIKYDGLKYSNLEDAFMKAAAQEIKEMIERKLEPFKSEIINQEGQVNVNINKDLQNMNIEILNLSKELSNRIETTLKS